MIADNKFSSSRILVVPNLLLYQLINKKNCVNPQSPFIVFAKVATFAFEISFLIMTSGMFHLK